MATSENEVERRCEVEDARWSEDARRTMRDRKLRVEESRENAGETKREWRRDGERERGDGWGRQRDGARRGEGASREAEMRGNEKARVRGIEMGRTRTIEGRCREPSDGAATASCRESRNIGQGREAVSKARGRSTPEDPGQRLVSLGRLQVKKKKRPSGQPAVETPPSSPERLISTRRAPPRILLQHSNTEPQRHHLRLPDPGCEHPGSNPRCGRRTECERAK